MTNDTLVGRLAAALAAANMTARQASIEAGLGATYLRDILNGDSKHPTSKKLQQLATVLNADAQYLQKGKPKVEIPASFTENGGTQMRIDPKITSLMSSLRDVPVYATHKSEIDGFFTLDTVGSPVDFARRPTRLINVMGIFAIQINDNSMEPWRRPGSIIFAHERREPSDGCHVIVQMAGCPPGYPPRAYVKHLVHQSATEIELEQYNLPERFKLPVSAVAKMFRVLEWEDLIDI